jgi:hypothetical protein
MLQASDRSKALAHLHPFSKWEMRILRPIVQAFVRTMLDVWNDLTLCRAIGAQFISHHPFWEEDAIWAVDRYLPDLSRANEAHPVLTPSMHFSTRLQRFAHARLLASYLTGSSPTFSSTLTTSALYDRSLRWFEAGSCKPAPRGQPSSPVQHSCLGSA